MPKVNAKTIRKGRTVSQAKRYATANKRSSNIRSRRAVMRATVHRRLASYPKTDDSKWLDTLAWFGSLALKLFTLTFGVEDDLTATTVTTSSGTALSISAADIAAVSPFGIPCTFKPDKEVTALRMMPYQRASLPSITVRITPSVDLGTRGGMYAAVLVRPDQLDSQVDGINYLHRFTPDYDTIIKHPGAVLSAVTRPITLRSRCNFPPKDIRVKWDETSGYFNQYPSYVLLIAFSDMASKSKDVAGQYAPNKSLFEIHITGSLKLFDPHGLQDISPSDTLQQCCVTSKLCSTDVSKINVACFDKRQDFPYDAVKDGKIDLRSAPREFAEHVLRSFNREDLLLELSAHHMTLAM